MASRDNTDTADATQNFGALLGIEHRPAPPGRSLLVLKLRQNHCNRFGAVHGGVILAMLDAAGLWSASPDASGLPPGVTASLNCSFLRGVRIGDADALHAQGEITKRGKNIYFSSITVTAAPSGTVLASAQGVYSVISTRATSGA